MAQEKAIFIGSLVKKEGKLVYYKDGSSKDYERFVKTIEENQFVDVFFEACKDDGTLTQLAKVHVCLRELAKEVGHSIVELKIIINQRAGLSYIDEHKKSWSICSKDELSLVIQTIIEIGDTVGIDFRDNAPVRPILP